MQKDIINAAARAGSMAFCDYFTEREIKIDQLRFAAEIAEDAVDTSSKKYSAADVVSLFTALIPPPENYMEAKQICEDRIAQELTKHAEEPFPEMLPFDVFLGLVNAIGGDATSEQLSSLRDQLMRWVAVCDKGEEVIVALDKSAKKLGWESLLEVRGDKATHSYIPAENTSKRSQPMPRKPSRTARREKLAGTVTS